MGHSGQTAYTGCAKLFSIKVTIAVSYRLQDVKITMNPDDTSSNDPYGPLSDGFLFVEADVRSEAGGT